MRAERDRLGPRVLSLCAEPEERRVQRVPALLRMTGGAKRERQTEQQRRPLLRPIPLGKQVKCRAQPLRGGPRRPRLDGVRCLSQQADRPEITKLGGTLDVMSLRR